MYPAIVFLPLAGFLIAGVFGRYIGVRLSLWVTSGLLVLCALLSWIGFFQVALGGKTVTVHLLTWIDSGAFEADWRLGIDTLTVVMFVVITTVSSLVHIYSIGYMSHDRHQPRFFAYLSLFTFAMLILVSADNFIQLFFGWEGVGLASYLLIGFWYEKPEANAAAIKAFVVNRVGDFGLILAIGAIYLTFGSVDFNTVFAAAADVSEDTFTFLGYEVPTLTTICLLLFVGAMGKSAQFLLHTWLPDAMEGPTPVSALIHAATMVTAGVFLVCRASPMFEYSQDALVVVTVVGATTAFFAATVGLAQNDIKRVIAYSTCSQLGYMFAAAGFGAYEAAMFHLFTHAFFKALLFLGAGSVIHAMNDEQDMRKMGGLYKLIPFTYIMMLVGTIALTGFPLTSGYFSKDAIIEAAFAARNPAHMYAFTLLLVAAFCTSLYSWRLIFMTFHGKSRASNETLGHVHESPYVMSIPLAFLATGALFAGLLFSSQFVGHLESSFWGLAIHNQDGNEILRDLHTVPAAVKWAPVFMMAAGFISAFYLYIRWPDMPGELARTHEPVYRFLLNKWYIDELYHLVIVKPAFWLGRLFWKGGDERIIDGLGPDGITARVLNVAHGFVRLQTGYIYHYAFVMLLGVASLVTFFMFGGGH